MNPVIILCLSIEMLEGEVLNQEITHKQEVPEYERTYVINIDHPMTEKSVCDRKMKIM